MSGAPDPAARDRLIGVVLGERRDARRSRLSDRDLERHGVHAPRDWIPDVVCMARLEEDLLHDEDRWHRHYGLAGSDAA